MDLKEEALLAGDAGQHWYYRAKLAALLDALAGIAPGPVLDIGAGTGFFARALLERGAATQATCVDTGYAADRNETVAGRHLAFHRVAPPPTAATVLLMDVLEHVPDDADLLRTAIHSVAPGSHIIITVPAFAWLWSAHDTFLGHHRRYTLAGLDRLLRQAGLHVERSHYLYGLVLPLAVVQRLRMRGGPVRSAMQPFGPVANAALGALCRVEQPVARFNRLAGLTVMARAVVPG